MSQISLTFQFENIHQLTEFCARCTGVVPSAPHSPESEVQDPIRRVTSQPAVTGTPAEGAVPAPTTKRRRGRKSNAEKAAEAAALKTAAPTPAVPASVESLPSVGVEAAPVSAVTKDDALDAFKKLHEAKGMGPCIDLLKRHGATRFGEVLPDAYPKFVQDIADIMAGKDIAAAS